MGTLINNSLRWNTLRLLFILVVVDSSSGDATNLQIYPKFQFKGQNSSSSPSIIRFNSVRREIRERQETDWSNESTYKEESSEEELHQRSTTIENHMTHHHHHHHSNAIVKEPSSSSPVHCPGCQIGDQKEKTSSEAIRILRLERIKEKILKKLRLKEPPNVSGFKVLPDPFLTTTYHHSHNNRATISSHSNDMDDYYGKTEQVIVFAEEGVMGSCHPRRSVPSACLTFKLPREVVREKADLRATSAELWVYTFEDEINSNRVMTVAEISASDLHNGPKATSLDPKHTLNTTDGWEAMNVSATVGVWMNKTLHFRMERDSPALTLQIGCRNCTKYSPGSTSPIDILNSQHRPFLVINMAEKMQKSRRRRNTNCHRSGPTECCRESFKVSFSQIGWDWITHPKEFDAYYCRGRCGGMRARHHHTSAMEAQINARNGTASTSESEALIPCCTPKKLSGITIIVRLTNNTSETKDLPNMVVESCGCAGDEEIL